MITFLPKIIKVRKNEIDIFKNCINITNYNSSKIQFIKGITTPGKGFYSKKGHIVFIMMNGLCEPLGRWNKFFLILLIQQRYIKLR